MLFINRRRKINPLHAMKFTRLQPHAILSSPSKSDGARIDPYPVELGATPIWNVT